MENAGVPVATITTEKFLGLAGVCARSLGLPDLQVCVVPHPVGGKPEAEVREVASRVVDSVIRVLTRPVAIPQT